MSEVTTPPLPADPPAIDHVKQKAREEVQEIIDDLIEEPYDDPPFGKRLCNVCKRRTCHDHGPFVVGRNGIEFKPIAPEAVRKYQDAAREQRKMQRGGK